MSPFSALRSNIGTVGEGSGLALFSSVDRMRNTGSRPLH